MVLPQREVLLGVAQASFKAIFFFELHVILLLLLLGLVPFFTLRRSQPPLEEPDDAV